MHDVDVIAQQTTQSGVSLTAVWIGAGVAVFGALLAAGTAQWRQRVELRHDRELADLIELRNVLDEAAAMTYAVMEEVIPAYSEWAGRGEPYRADELSTLNRKMDSMLARLVLRLGETHRVSVTFGQYRMACGDIESTMLTQVFQPPTAEEPNLDRALERLRRDFLVACLAVVGSMITERPEELSES